MASAQEPIIHGRGLCRIYRLSADVTVRALADADIDIRSGQLTAVMGPSGSGKSTLLNILGCMDTPDAGELTIADRRIARASAGDLAPFRLATIGMVFQRFNLLDHLSALENTALPLRYVRPRLREAECRRRAEAALAALGLAGRTHHRPDQLSGGEQQRVGVARAVINSPRILLADEPTGELDSETGAQILERLLLLARDEGRAVVVVTHDPAIADHADRIVRMVDGRVIDGVS